MSADDAAHGEDVPARRGRRAHKPAAAKTTTVRSGSKKLDGGQLTQRLNQLVAELIKENRKLKREVVKLTERLKVAATSVKRGARTIQRRVKKAKTAPAKRRPRKTVTSGATRKRAVRKTVTAAATRKRGVKKKRRKTS
jgi:hypothetical protein